MLQTMKELVINMIPQITNQQRSNVLSPSPNDMLNTQPPNFPHHGSLLSHPYPPQLNMPPSSNQIPPSTSHPTTPPVYIQQQSTQGITPTTQTLSPTLQKSPTSPHSQLPPSQTSFDHVMNAIDTDL